MSTNTNNTSNITIPVQQGSRTVVVLQKKKIPLLVIPLIVFGGLIGITVVVCIILFTTGVFKRDEIPGEIDAEQAEELDNKLAGKGADCQFEDCVNLLECEDVNECTRATRLAHCREEGCSGSEYCRFCIVQALCNNGTLPCATMQITDCIEYGCEENDPLTGTKLRDCYSCYNHPDCCHVNNNAENCVQCEIV